jgi:hypothetical protein
MSRISHEPSFPASSTEPDIPDPLAPDASWMCAVRIAVSVSHRYSTGTGAPPDGSTCTAICTDASTPV